MHPLQLLLSFLTIHWMRYVKQSSSRCKVHTFSLLFNNAINYCFQVSNGATYVNIDMLENKKDGSRMLLVEGRFIFL